MLNKLAIGTVQFGLKYGINNQSGQVNVYEVGKILSLAREKGIDTLDTARAYGESEEILGRVGIQGFKVISKLPPCKPKEIKFLIEKSLQNLKLKRLYGYMIHNFSSYIKYPEIWDILQELKSDGKIDKIGFSLYSPNEMLRIHEKGIIPDLIQVPYNLFDRRFENAFPNIKQQGTEIHVRSIFLQGLLLMNVNQIPEYFISVKKKIEYLEIFSKVHKISKTHISLLFSLQNPLIDKVVIGLDSEKQLSENIRLDKVLFKKHQWLDFIRDMEVNEENIINPSKWPIFNA